MSRIQLIITSVLATLLLSACSPKQHKPVDIAVSFITQAPDSMLVNDKYQQPMIKRWLRSNLQQAFDRAQVNNTKHIAFYSDQNLNKPLLTPAFSYVTALVLNEQNADMARQYIKPNHSIIASNINFGLKQYGAKIYAYNAGKSRADAYIQSVNNEKIAYLSLINQSNQLDDKPEQQDLDIIAHSVDRLYVQGVNKIILLSQYSGMYSSSLANKINGLDVIVSTGENYNTTFSNGSCIAYFDDKGDWKDLYLKFDINGKIISCDFMY
ncbi:hypothetical protein L4D09_08585 [Photobacterium makurazakiensis]|uniref:hypothetical protein n=1 Tax=Photobacterium makurazakiensis TaxID=2910234 RepID=UPI003D0ACBF0